MKLITLNCKKMIKLSLNIQSHVQTMDERHTRERLRKSGPSVIARPGSLMIQQWCTHRPSVKYVQAQACPCRATNCPCMSGCPSENFRNRGPTGTPPPGGKPRAPTDLRLMSNVNRNIEEAHESALILCQATPPPIFFHPDAPYLSLNILTVGEYWLALPASSKNSHAT